MVIRALLNVGKVMTATAAVIPGVDAITEALGESAGMEAGEYGLHWGDAPPSPDSFDHSLGNFSKSLHDANKSIAGAAASVSNSVGIDHLAGLEEWEKLTAEHFTEDFGVIPKVVGNAWDSAPDIWDEVTAEENRVAAVTGAATGAVAISMLPNTSQELGTELRQTPGRIAAAANNTFNTVQQGAKASADAARGVSNATSGVVRGASDTANSATSFVDRLTGASAKPPARQSPSQSHVQQIMDQRAATAQTPGYKGP